MLLKDDSDYQWLIPYLYNIKQCEDRLTSMKTRVKNHVTINAQLLGCVTIKAIIAICLYQLERCKFQETKYLLCIWAVQS